MSKKPAIPTFGTDPRSVHKALQAIKITIETITGAVGGPIEKLPADADLGAAVAKINEIIARINARGE